MDVKYTETLRQWGEGHTLVQQAQQRLERVLGASADVVKAEWDLTTDARGRPLISLRLRDHTGNVQGLFAPDELRSEPQTNFRLYRLWGDLLQAKTANMLQQLAEAEN